MSKQYSYGEHAENLPGKNGSKLCGQVTDASRGNNTIEIDFISYVRMRPTQSLSQNPVWIRCGNPRQPSDAEKIKLALLKKKFEKETQTKKMRAADRLISKQKQKSIEFNAQKRRKQRPINYQRTISCY